jgi:hypothetical protein
LRREILHLILERPVGGAPSMVEANKQLSVSFLASLFITLLSAVYAIADGDNALWAFPSNQPYGWWLNLLINGFFWAGPFANLAFYYIFEAELETNEEKTAALKGVLNVEWYLRLISQFILALMWFLLAQKHIVLFLIMQFALYVSIIVWDIVVVFMCKKREMMDVLKHDGWGFVLTLGYCFVAWVLYRFRIDIAAAGQLPPDQMLLFMSFVILMAVAVTLNIGNIYSAVRGAKIRLGWHMLPRMTGVRS